jgi:hypothetical protein
MDKSNLRTFLQATPKLDFIQSRGGISFEPAGRGDFLTEFPLVLHELTNAGLSLGSFQRSIVLEGAYY